MLTLFSVLAFQFSMAQDKTITGTVTDQDGLPLPGANVLIKGAATGTQTDFDGNYAIRATVGEVLVFSYIGLTTEERTVGASDVINIQLAEDAQALEEVVVTALGIERSERTLGYGVSTVKAEDLTVARETNVLNALQGKTTGVQITNQSGNVGGSTKILIRGLTRLSGNNNPLWVVDGVPISDANIATGSRITGGFDFGNRAQDINLDDVESVSVLKGASAAALYGSRASNGVIIVTTKKGKSQKANVSYSSIFRFDDPLRLPTFQNEFGPGDQGAYDEGNGDTLANSPAGWGPAISTRTPFTNVAGEPDVFTAYPNLVDDFYRTGKTSINSFAISGTSNEGRNDYRVSTSYTDQEGIVPASVLNRLNVGLNAGAQLSETLASRFSVNYVRTNIRGNAAQGANDPNVLTNIVNQLPRTTDIDLFVPWIDEDGNQLSPVGTNVNNPYWVANENRAESEVDRFFGNVTLDYQPFQKVGFVARAGYDTFNDKRFRSNRNGTLGRINGDYTEDDINNRELTLDFIATYDDNFGDALDLTFRAGTQWNERVFERIGNVGTDLTVPLLYTPGNAGNNAPFNGFSERRILGVFGDLTLTYKGWLTLNATGRNDWSSTLPEGENSFFYPSVATSFVFSDAFGMEGDFFSYGKLRGSWANVGGDADPYQLDFLYAPQTTFFGQFGTGGNFPFQGELAFSGPGTLPNQALKPENQVNYEAGIELGFFRNRITLDATYYENFTDDQILAVTVPESTGFNASVQNIGRVSNKGFELELGARVIQTDNFSWQLDYNFSTNDFVVEELTENVDRFVVGSGFNSTQIIAEPGESLGLYGNRWARAVDENGDPIDDQILVDPASGLRFQGDNGRLGNILPDFIMGLTSAFNYKGWTLSTTFDWREGGVMFSNTAGSLRRAGLAAETAVDRDDLFVDPNTFIDNGDGTYSANTTPIQSVQGYWNAFANASIAEGNTFDATFMKWREVSLFYTFTQDQLRNMPFTAIRIGFQGRNLAVFNTSVPHVDPETNLFGSASNGAGIERGSVPSTRSLGFNLQVNF